MMSMHVPTRSSPSAVHWHWAVHADVWLESEPYMLVLGSYMLALGYRGQCWLYTLALGSKCRCWVVDAGIGLETEALGHTHWCWVANSSAGFEMSGLVVNAGIRLNTSVSVRRHWRWVMLVQCREICVCRYGVCKAGPAGKRAGVEDGGCEQRVAVTCDIAFVTSPNWDVSNCVARPLICDTVSRMRLIPFWGVCRCTYIL